MWEILRKFREHSTENFSLSHVFAMRIASDWSNINSLIAFFTTYSLFGWEKSSCLKIFFVQTVNRNDRVLASRRTTRLFPSRPISYDVIVRPKLRGRWDRRGVVICARSCRASKWSNFCSVVSILARRKSVKA